MVTVNAAFDQHLKERSEATRNFLTLNKQRLAGSGAGTKGGAGTAYGVSSETEGDVGDLLAGTGAGGAGDTLSSPAPVFMYSGACAARFPCCPHCLSPLFFVHSSPTLFVPTLAPHFYIITCVVGVGE